MLNDSEKLNILVGIILIGILSGQVAVHLAGAWNSDIASIFLVILNIIATGAVVFIVGSLLDG